MSDEIDRRQGAAALLGTIGGLLPRAVGIRDIRPVLATDSHEVVALDVTTSHGTFRVTTEPRD